MFNKHIEKLFLFLLCFLQCGRARDIECNVTESAERTEYSISNGHRVSEAEAPGCGYSWANGSNNVLAHEEDKDPELVVKNGVNNLITYTCFNNMVFKRLCKSEGKGYTAYCATNCTDAFRRPQRHNGMSPAGIIGIVLVGVCIISIAMCLRFRHNIYRMCSSKSLRLRRTNTSMQSVSQRDVVDV